MHKILFINNLGLGGAERVVSRLFQNDNINNEAMLWVLNDRVFYDCTVKKRVNLNKRYKLLTCIYALIKLVKLDSTKLIQAHLNQPILLSTLAKALGANFNLQTVHCFAYSSFYTRRGYLGLVHKYIFSKLLKYVDFHIFKSYEMLDDFEITFGWKPDKFSVIYNPYDISSIEKSSCESVNNLHLHNKLNVAIVGRLNASKRSLDIIELAARTDSVAHYHLFGDGPLKDILLTSIKNRKIKNITLHGMIENPFKYVKKMGVYLSLSESEGFPNALIESMICSAIPIHSDCKTGPKEILCDSYEDYSSVYSEFSIHKRGILFPVGDIDAVAKAMFYTAKNHKELKRKFNNESQDFIKALNLEKITEKYHSTLNKNYL